MPTETQAQQEEAASQAAAQVETAAPVETQSEATTAAPAAEAPAPLPVVVAVSDTPGLDAYRDLLDLQDDRDRHLAEIDRLNGDIASLQAQRSEHSAVLSGLPTKAKELQKRVMNRVDAIVGAFAA